MNDFIPVRMFLFVRVGLEMNASCRQ